MTTFSIKPDLSETHNKLLENPLSKLMCNAIKRQKKVSVFI